jgi:hypothetical protein
LSPYRWWTVKSDISLLHGCWKHGYANYDEMKKDPDHAHVVYGPDYKVPAPGE